MTLPPPNRRGFTLVELLVVVAVISVLVALLLPAVQSARESARRMKCSSNLRNLAQAVLNYESLKEKLPPAVQSRTPATFSTSATPPLARHNGITLLLPYFEEGAAFDAINLKLDWNHPANAPHTRQDLGGILLCPSAPGGRQADHTTDYQAATRIDVDGATSLEALLDIGLIDKKGGAPDNHPIWDGALQRDFLHLTNPDATDRRKVRTNDIVDGLSNTWLYIESGGKPFEYVGRKFIDEESGNTRFRWASAENFMVINDFCNASQLINCNNSNRPYSFHEGGMNASFADSHIRFISEDIDPQIFVSLLTLAGNEILAEDF